MKKRKKPFQKLSKETYFDSLVLYDDYPCIDYKHIIDNELSNQEDYKIIFDACFIEKTSITNNTFSRTEFIDTIFKNCDL